MPRVHFVKKARKDNPAVSAGESYYHWKFRYGGKRYSKTRPRQSQLCQGKNSAFYAALETLEDGCENAFTLINLTVARDEAMGSLEEVRDEYQEGFDNLPENFQYAATGEAIQEAIDSIEELLSELECWEDDEYIEDDFDEAEPSLEDYENNKGGVEDYQSEVTGWEERKADHGLMEAEQAENHLYEKRDELNDMANNHSFPY